MVQVFEIMSAYSVIAYAPESICLSDIGYWGVISWLNKNRCLSLCVVWVVGEKFQSLEC